MALLWTLSLIDCKISAFVPLTCISLRKIRLCALGRAIFVQVCFTPPALKNADFRGTFLTNIPRKQIYRVRFGTKPLCF